MKARQDPKCTWPVALVRVRSGNSTAKAVRVVGTRRYAYLHVEGGEGYATILHASGPATLRAIADAIYDALDGKEPKP